MFASNSPSVFGLVSIRQATSSSAFARRSSTSTPPSLVGADLDDLVAGHRHRRRVGAVRGVGREDLRAVLAAVLVVGAGEQHAGELAVRAGARLQRDVRQAGDLAERLLELPHQLAARPGRAWGPAAGAGARCRAAPRRARAASGCASSCTSRAGRSRCRGRSCASRAGCSGGRSPARRSRAASAARRGGSCSGSSSSLVRARRARARRTRAGPACDFSKIVTARSRCIGVSNGRAAARMRRRALDLGSACRRFSLITRHRSRSAATAAPSTSREPVDVARGCAAR